MPACACSSMASGRGHSFSTASRSRCSDPTPGLPPHENISFADAAGADHLVVDDVGRHPHHRQIPALLPDDFVPGGKWNEMGEPFERQAVAVVDELLDGFPE